jgi:hypothetical protein
MSLGDQNYDNAIHALRNRHKTAGQVEDEMTAELLECQQRSINALTEHVRILRETIDALTKISAMKEEIMTHRADVIAQYQASMDAVLAPKASRAV